MILRAVFISFLGTGLLFVTGTGAQGQEPECAAIGTPTTPDIAAPTSLQISLDPVSLEVVLTWQDNADNETCYFLQRTFISDLQEVQYLAANTTQFRETLFDRQHSGPGEYCYGVRAENVTGSSEQAWGCVNVPAAFVPPRPTQTPVPPMPGPEPLPFLPFIGPQPDGLPDTGGAPADSGEAFPWRLLPLAGAVAIMLAAGSTAIFAIWRSRRLG